MPAGWYKFAKTLKVDVLNRHGTKEMRASASGWCILQKTKRCIAFAAGFFCAEPRWNSRRIGVKQELTTSKKESRRLEDMKIPDFTASAWHNGNHLSIDFSVD